MEELRAANCCHNEEQEKRESATRMIRDLADAAAQLQRVNVEVREHNRSAQDKTVRVILDKIRGLLGEM